MERHEVTILGEPKRTQEATKEFFKEVENGGERFSDRRASGDGNRKTME